MSRRNLYVGLMAVGLFLAGFGIATFPAIADLRVITITLKGGQKVTTTVDVPPGTPLDQIQLPEVTAPIEGIEEAKPQSQSGQGDATAPKHEDSSSDKSGDHERKTASKHEGISESEAQPQDQESEKKSGSDIRRADGVPTAQNPTLSVSLPGPAPVGVPNFVINKFRIPPFLLPIYQAAGVQYGVRWEVLAAINEIETDYGRNLNVSSAGALGWMQFIPSSWRTYGVDANQDGQKDPYNPVDAIFAAGRYLKAAGGEKDLRRAIFAYNHADWYVDSVLMRARLIAGMPADVIGSVTGMTQGHFPVHAEARYADDLRERDAKRLGKKVRRAHNAAKVITPSTKRRSINIYSRRGAPVIAVNDGVVKKIGNNTRLGRYIVLQDVYGNRYTYAHLGKVSKRYPVPRTTSDEQPTKQDEFKTARVLREKAPELPKPSGPASAGRQVASGDPTGKDAYAQPDATLASSSGKGKERLFADPDRAGNRTVAEARGQLQQEQLGRSDYQVFKVYFSRVFRLSPSDVKLKTLKKGSKVIGGTVLGKVGKVTDGPGSNLAPHLNFSIRPAGRGAPRIDPKPILDGWRLLEATALYRAAGSNPFSGPDDDRPSTGQILLMSKEALERRVLADPHVKIYDCGRDNIRAGEIDRRVLATLEFLVASGLSPTVTSLKCGHSYLTSSGNVSEHSSGNAVDIAKVNDIPIYGHQGPNSITETTIRRLLALQGVMQPDQIISLMDMGPPTLSMADHDDHIHVGFKPMLGPNEKLGRAARRLLSNTQWDRLVTRLGNIDNPIVRSRPSKYSIKVKRHKRASRAHQGE